MVDVVVKDGGGGGFAVFETDTVAEVDAVLPSVLYAWIFSVCEPLLTVVVSNWFPSPLNWYGEYFSVHFTFPSIRKSTWLAAAPPVVAVQTTDPERLMPPFSAVLPMLDETVNLLPAAAADTDPTMTPANARATTSRALTGKCGFTAFPLATPFAWARLLSGGPSGLRTSFTRMGEVAFPRSGECNSERARP